MKKTLASILSLILVLCMVFSFAACNGNQAPETTTAADVVTTTEPVTEEITTEPVPEKVMTLVIGTEAPVSYEVDLSKVEITEGLISVLDYLKETQGLDYVAEESSYGKFLTKAGDIEQKDNVYVSLYTSNEADQDTSEYATSVEFDGQTLVSAAVGASSLTIAENVVIYIGTYTYEA